MGGATLNSRSQLFHNFGTTTTAGTVHVIPVASVLPVNTRAAIYAMIVTVSTASTMLIQDTTPTTISQTFQLAINGSIVLDMRDNGDFWWQATGAGLGIDFVFTATPTAAWDVWWYSSV
jgi:hypothetical protein